MIIVEREHPIRKNHSSAYPSRMLFLDTETRQTKDGNYTRHDLLLGWTCYRRHSDRTGKSTDTWKYWEKPKLLCEYINSLVSAKKALQIYGHNIAFDLQVIQFYKWFPKWDWKLEFIYDTGLTYLLVIGKNRMHIKCISTTNYYSVSLADLGESLGLRKLDVDFKTTTKKELSIYCKRDVLITIKAMERYIAFNKTHDTGKFSMTRASQSFSAFRHRFMGQDLYPHQIEEIQKLERDAYFGGRTECFKIGKIRGKSFTFLDVNSMYPYVMRKNLFPVRCLWYNENPEESEWKPFLSGYAIIAEVTLTTTEPIYAKRHNGKLIFPIGTFDTCVCTEGFKHAIDAEHLVKVKRISIYEWGPIFRNYVDYFYPLKQKYKAESNPIFTATVKLFLNSLYGKFGQKIAKEDKIPVDTKDYTTRVDCYDQTTGDRWTDTILFNTLIRHYGEEDGPNTFTAIPAHVTEYARFYLWRIMAGIGRDNVFYCDTDSLAIRTSTIRRKSIVLDPLSLGSLSIDKQGESFHIHGLKDYQIGIQRKLKGVPLRATQNGEDSYTYDSFLGSTSHQRLNETSSFLTREITKTISHDYNKGTLSADGKVSPYSFPLS